MTEVVKIILITFFLGMLGITLSIGYMTWMPKPTLLLNENEITPDLLALKDRLRVHIEQLSKSSIGRNYIDKDHITPAKNYILTQFNKLGLNPSLNDYEIYGDKYSNIIIDIPSEETSSPVLIVGAHYDSIENSPGANDNASGVAALIEMARYFSRKHPAKYHLRLIAFANEEPPYFQTEEMGSLVYAKSLPGAEKILGMLSLETIGYYTDVRESQDYPKLFKLFYPEAGNFVAFIGNIQSRALVTSSISLFRQNSTVPSEGVAAPGFVPGVGWSDHWSFWVTGHMAIMVTDTAPYRYTHYHERTDTPDKLNYEQYTKVVFGLFKVVDGLLEHGIE